MIETLNLIPTDQVLLVSITELSVVTAVARRLTQGLVVGVGDADFVSAARGAAREFDNVMFHCTTPDEIPFRDGFFTVVICGATPVEPAVEREIQRVLAVNGRIVCIRPAALKENL